MRIIFGLFFVALLSFDAWGQTSFTATYDLSGSGNNVTSFDYNGTSYTGIVPGALVKVGITSSSSTSNFRGSNWPTGATSGSDTFTGIMDAGKYVGFTIDPASGYKLTVTSIEFGVGRSSTGPRQWQWRASGDSYAAALSGYTTISSGLTNASGELTNPDANSSWTGNTLELGSGYANQTGTVEFRLYGYNSESTSGTGGLQGNITITGTFESLGGSTPTKLVITTINGGSSPSKGTTFEVVVQSRDGSDIAQNVAANTDISLSLATGSGTLGGTLTGTIPAGSNSVTISGVTYSKAETGVSITATVTSGDALSAGTSSTFTVLDAASQLAFTNVPTAGQQGVPLSSFAVEARRGDNSVDQNFTGDITVAVASGPGGISGTLTHAAVAGVATFDDIQLDAAGTYTLSAASSGLTGATSGSIDILSTALPLVEDFEYTPGSTLVSNGWVAHSGAGTNSVTVGSGALTYAGYSESGKGNKAAITANGEDVNRTFTSVTTGSVYASFMVNVTSASTGGDYFFHVGTSGTMSYYARVFVEDDGSGNLAFGIAKNVTDSVVYTPFDYLMNTTYLLAIRYTFNSGTTTDDQVDLWVNPVLDPLPPDPPTVSQTDAGTDATSLGMIALRQGANSPVLTISGIRVGATWPDAPLPVTMSSMAATAEAGRVCLTFSTGSETDVAGFEILRSESKNGPFMVVSTYVSNASLKASGTPEAGTSYEFVDTKVSAGQTYYYRIDAVDKSGTSAQAGNVIEVRVTAPKTFAVYQNYPNPFNPTTTVRYDLKEQSNVLLEVYNVLGMRVMSENFRKDAGTYETQVNLSNMPSGIYYLRMTMSGKSGAHFISTRKALLMK